MEFMTGVNKKETLEISELLAGDYEGKSVKVNGAVHTIRDMGEVAFIVLRKREGLLQCVYEEGKTQFDLKDLKEAATIEVEGTVKPEERAPHGFEIRLDKIKVLSEPAAPMPLAISKWKLNTSLDTLFQNYHFRPEFIETMLRNYTYLNTGLSIYYNGHRIVSRNGLEDLLNDNMTAPGLYPIVHLTGEDIEIAFTHSAQYGEEYYSFVNGQHTTQGGTHQSAFKEHIARAIKEFYGKNLEFQDIRNGLVAAIAINVIEPTFESQTKIKLGSLSMAPEKDSEGNPYPLSGVSVNKFVGDFVKEQVDNYLHKHPDVAEVLLQKIQESEKERKAIAGVTKIARERAKKANLHNRKLRDCRIHLNDQKGGKKEEDDPRLESSIFITEGDSASGSITKSRDVNTQAVFSLRGKPLNSFGLTKSSTSCRLP